MTTTMRADRAATRLLALTLAAGLGAACGGDDPTGPGVGSDLELRVEGLHPLPPGGGTLRAWVTTASGDTVDAGAFQVGQDGVGTHAFRLTVDRPRETLVAWEPEEFQGAGPSPWILLSGSFRGGTAELELWPPRQELNPEPGAHSLFTTSNNVELGYPSFENAGLWLFTLLPSQNAHRSREVKLTSLEPAWTYEGWAVRELGTEREVWLSYGKFRPDWQGLLSSRDDTGSGPFSGDADYLNAGVEDVPGEEWNTDRVATQLGLSMPEGLALPLALDAVDPATGEALWTHVITIEPSYDEGEPLMAGTPFMVRPYGNPIGEGRAGDPRRIELREAPPTGTVRASGLPDG